LQKIDDILAGCLDEQYRFMLSEGLFSAFQYFVFVALNVYLHKEWRQREIVQSFYPAPQLALTYEALVVEKYPAFQPVFSFGCVERSQSVEHPFFVKRHHEKSFSHFVSKAAVMNENAIVSAKHFL